jgi:hypothetical protein
MYKLSLKPLLQLIGVYWKSSNLSTTELIVRPIASTGEEYSLEQVLPSLAMN